MPQAGQVLDDFSSRSTIREDATGPHLVVVLANDHDRRESRDLWGVENFSQWR